MTRSQKLIEKLEAFGVESPKQYFPYWWDDSLDDDDACLTLLMLEIVDSLLVAEIETDLKNLSTD